jgi:cell division transport system ATP-binding protein
MPGNANWPVCSLRASTSAPPHDQIPERHQDVQGIHRRPRDCSVEIDKGEFVFLVGPSGSGKTTFIRLLLREEMPDSGPHLGGRQGDRPPAKWRIPYLRRNIGCVFQDFRLLPNKTVFENVAFALEVIGRPKHVIANQVPQVLDLVGLTKKRDNLPGELSGGEQQRVAVARAFVNRPLILLADEPTGNLDPTTSLGIMRLLDRINRTGTTVIIATHDAGMVDQMRRRVIELDRGTAGARPGPRGLRHRQRHRRPPGPARPPAPWWSRCPGGRRPVEECPAASPPVPDAVSAGYVSGGRHQPVAQPSDDGGRHPHRGGVAGPGGLVPAAQAGRLKATVQWQNGVNDHRLGQAHAGAGQIQAIGTELGQSPYIKSCIYRSQAYDYNEAKTDPAGRRVQRHHRVRLPVVVPVRAERPVPGPRRLPGVHRQARGLRREVPGQQIKTMQSVIRILQWVFLSVAVVLLLSASVLILNTIRMAIFARRREVSVMKLVGATNWFIRLPFMAEG